MVPSGNETWLQRQGAAILLADDDQAICFCLGRALLGLGLVVHVAADGVSALRLYHQHAARIQAVFLDWQLPGRDGLSVLRELRDQRPDLPVCLMSASTNKRAVDEIADATVSFLSKPFDLDAFFRELDELLIEPLPLPRTA